MNKMELIVKKGVCLMLLALLFPSCIPPPAGYRWYYVRRKDTLWSIAAKNKVDVVNLINSNNISNPSLIYPGMRLKISSRGRAVSQKRRPVQRRRDRLAGSGLVPDCQQRGNRSRGDDGGPLVENVGQARQPSGVDSTKAHTT